MSRTIGMFGAAACVLLAAASSVHAQGAGGKSSPSAASTASPSTAPASPAAPTPAATTTSPATNPPPPTADQIARAKTLFDLGAKAYDSEQFPAAIQAFEEAYRLSQRPGPIFSTAQAYRRLYTTDRKVDTLRRAVQNYKLYIDKQKAGGRIGEAQQALRDLEPLLNDLLAGNASAAAVPLASSATDTKPKTRLMVSSSTKGALASLDGGEPAELPLIQELTPGPHKLRLSAEGFVDDEREIVAFEGQVFGLDVSLRERPALLTIGTEAGADVSIDGRNEGTTPLPKALEIAPGTRLVTITKTGYRPYSAEIDFRRDERRPLEVKLQQTTQRVASFVVMGTALGGLIAGGVVTGLAFLAQTRAIQIEGFKSERNLTPQELNEHATAVRMRDDLRIAGVGAFGGAALLGVVGAGMFIFDSSAPGLPTRIRDEQKKPEAARQPKVGFSITPWVSPALAGGSVQFSF